MSDPKVHVTDHAVVRYLECTHGLDVQEIKQTIRHICQRGAKKGAPCVKHNKLRYMLVDKTVVTIMGRVSRPTHASLVRAKRKR